MKDNTIVAVRGDETNPNTRGYTCNKARAIPNHVQHAQRIEHPLKRKPDGSFERISWDQAITEIAAKLKGIHQANAPRSIALVDSRMSDTAKRADRHSTCSWAWWPSASIASKTLPNC